MERLDVDNCTDIIFGKCLTKKEKRGFWTTNSEMSPANVYIYLEVFAHRRQQMKFKFNLIFNFLLTGANRWANKYRHWEGQSAGLFPNAKVNLVGVGVGVGVGVLPYCSICLHQSIYIYIWPAKTSFNAKVAPPSTSRVSRHSRSSRCHQRCGRRWGCRSRSKPGKCLIRVIQLQEWSDMSGSDKQTPSSRPSHCMFLTAVTAMNESDEPKKLVSGWGSEKKVRLAKPGKLSVKHV